MIIVAASLLFLTICVLVGGVIWTAEKFRPLLHEFNLARQREIDQGERLRQASQDHLFQHIKDLNKQTGQVFRDQQIINDQHMESLADIYSTTLTALTNNQEICTQQLQETVALATGTVQKILDATVLMVNPIQPTVSPGQQPPLTPNFYETTVAPFESPIPEIPEPMFYDQNPDIPNEQVQITEPSYGFVDAPDLAFHPSQMPAHLQAAFYGPGGLLNNGR